MGVASTFGTADGSNFGAILYPSVAVIIIKESLTKAAETTEIHQQRSCAMRASRVDKTWFGDTAGCWDRAQPE
jgi:hypothetical protein